MSAFRLLIFIKNAEIGKVKTRIAKEVGNQLALEIYQTLQHITRRVSLSVSAERHLFYSDHIDNSDAWPSALFTKHIQQGADLGQRMYDAFLKIFRLRSSDGNDLIVLIGSDCPELTSQILDDARSYLNVYDCVLGPANDGGYYLIGFSRVPDKSIFSDINWSTASVYKETIEKVKSAGYTFFELPSLSDIDTWADWQRYLHSANNN